MLLRITYSNTKMFFKRTLENFKLYFPKGYQRLPKTPPCNPFSCTGSRGVNTNHFTHSYREPEIMTTDHRKTMSNYIVDSKRPKAITNIHHDGNDEIKGSSKCLVTRKLKELETMEAANVDLVHDIEEVLHYYSRLTCPVYRDIMEKFFVQMYSGTFNFSGVN
uniref:uncharacterized protein LOC122597547 n=1 Tax=Erigeron canadensis TaxID=72917 RepID=UPI001CB9CB93|nr:uncharacterized protein LOC122597547 [Erigeron canadensis]